MTSGNVRASRLFRSCKAASFRLVLRGIEGGGDGGRPVPAGGPRVFSVPVYSDGFSFAHSLHLQRKFTGGSLTPNLAEDGWPWNCAFRKADRRLRLDRGRAPSVASTSRRRSLDFLRYTDN